MKRVRRRKIRLSVIRKHQSYYVDEVTRLLGVSSNTIRRWMKDGLNAMKVRRSYLIHGGTLHHYLKAKQDKRKRPCGVGELFCLRCGIGRKPFGLMVEVIACNEKIAQIRAICEECDAKMNRRCGFAKLSETLKPFEDITLLSATLTEWLAVTLRKKRTKNWPMLKMLPARVSV